MSTADLATIMGGANQTKPPQDNAGTMQDGRFVPSAAERANQQSAITGQKPITPTGGSTMGDDLQDAGSTVLDVAKGVVRGGIKAVDETLHLAGQVINSQQEAEAAESGEPNGGLLQPVVDSAANANLPKPSAPNTTPGVLAQGASQFLVAMAGLGKFRAATGLLANAPRLIKGAVDAGLAGAVAFDPYEQRLSNFLENHPSLANPISHYLASDPNDGQLEARFKAFLENAGLGAAGDGLLKVIGAIRSARPLAQAGKTAEAAQVVDKAAQDAQAAPQVTPGPLKGGGTASEPNVTLAGVQAAKDALEKGTAPEPTPAPQDRPAAPTAAPASPVTPEQSASAVAKVVQLAQTQQFDYCGPVMGTDVNLAHHLVGADAKQIINAISDTIVKPMGVEAQQGVVDAAAAMGGTPGDLLQAFSNAADAADRQGKILLATKMHVNWLSKNISDLARQYQLKVAASMDPQAEMAALQAHVDQIGQIQGYMQRIRAGGARATALGNADIGIPNVPMAQLTPDLIDKLAITHGEPASVVPIIKDPGPVSKLINGIIGYHTNALLASVPSVLTHVMGVVTNTALMNTEKYVLGGLFKSYGPRLLAEGAQNAMTFLQSFGDAAQYAYKAWVDQAPILEAHPGFENTAATMRDNLAKGNPEGVLRSLGSGIAYTVRALGGGLRIGLDEFSKQCAYRGFVAGKALTEAKANGWTDGPSIAQYINARVSDSLASGQNVSPEALRWAQENSFTQPIPDGTLTKDIQNLLGKHPVCRWFLPFLKVPYNIANSGLADRTPIVNFARQKYRDDFMGTNGPDAQALAHGKMLSGIAMWGGVYKLATSGYLTGSGPANPIARKQWLQTGTQPYSFKADDGSYVSYARMEPFATALAMAADAHDTYGHLSDDTWQDVASKMAIGLAANLNSKLYFKGMSEACNAGTKPAEYLKSWVQSQIASMVPGVANQAQQFFGPGDPDLREARGIIDRARERIPGLSENLAPERNIVGEPIPNPIGAGWSAVSPAMSTSQNNAPWAQEIRRLQYHGTFLPWKMGTVQLSPDQRDRWGQLVQGMGLERQLNQLVQSGLYKNTLTDSTLDYQGSREAEITRLVGTVRQAAWNKLLGEDKALREQVHTDQVRKAMSAIMPNQESPQRQQQ